MITSIEKGNVAYQGAPIRVTVAASVAFNPDAFKKGITGLMEKLGCGKCFSGFDCRFQLQRDYLIDPESKVQSLHQVSTSVNVLNIGLDKETSHSIGKIGDTVDRIFKQFGCAPCHSGLDILFRSELNQLAINHGM